MLSPTTQPPVELCETSMDLRVKHIVCNGKVLTSYDALIQFDLTLVYLTAFVQQMGKKFLHIYHSFYSLIQKSSVFQN